MNTTPSTWQRLQARVAASRFFTFSLLVHVIIVLLGGSVVLFKTMVQVPDFVGGDPNGLVADDEPRPPDDGPELASEMFRPDAPSTPEVVPTTILMPASLPTSAPIAITRNGAAEFQKSLAQVAMKSDGLSSKTLPPVMQGRRDSTSRGRAMAMTGGRRRATKR